MRALSSPTVLFRVDAVTCAGAALALLLGAGPADTHLGLPTALSYGAGAFLVAWTALALAAATRPALRIEVILGNAAWVVASVVVAATLGLTALGVFLVCAQAAAVAAITALQVRALRAPSGSSAAQPSTARAS